MVAFFYNDDVSGVDTGSRERIVFGGPGPGPYCLPDDVGDDSQLHESVDESDLLISNVHELRRVVVQQGGGNYAADATARHVSKRITCTTINNLWSNLWSPCYGLQ